jgi:hypothetical protein
VPQDCLTGSQGFMSLDEQIHLSRTSDVSLASLHQAGWTSGDTAFLGADSGIVWLVSGRNGENLIRAEGATRDEAWHRAVEQARSLGMLRD